MDSAELLRMMRGALGSQPSPVGGGKEVGVGRGGVVVVIAAVVAIAVPVIAIARSIATMGGGGGGVRGGRRRGGGRDRRDADELGPRQFSQRIFSQIAHFLWGGTTTVE